MAGHTKAGLVVWTGLANRVRSDDPYAVQRIDSGPIRLLSQRVLKRRGHAQVHTASNTAMVIEHCGSEADVKKRYKSSMSRLEFTCATSSPKRVDPG